MSSPVQIIYLLETIKMPSKTHNFQMDWYLKMSIVHKDISNASISNNYKEGFSYLICQITTLNFINLTKGHALDSVPVDAAMEVQ